MADRVFKKYCKCPTCGTEYSVFDSKTCPSCGANPPPRDTWKRRDGEAQITNPSELKRANAGGDWICAFCNGQNSATDKACTHCGSDRKAKQYKPVDISDGQEHHDLDNAVEIGNPVVNNIGSGTVTPESSYTPEPVRHYTTQVSGQNAAWVGAILLVGLAIFGFIFWATRTHDVSATVMDQSWTRTITVLVYQTVTHETNGSVPMGGREIGRRTHDWDVPIYRTETEHHDKTCYRTVTIDNGNGTETERDESYDCSYDTSKQVFDHNEHHSETIIKYEIEEWVHSRDVTANGTDHEPYWPKVVYNLDGQTVIGAEKYGSQSESYAVHLKDADGKDYNLNPPNVESYLKYHLGDVYKLTYNNLGMLLNNPLDQVQNKQ